MNKITNIYLNMNLNGSKSSSFPIANQWDKTFNKYDIQIELNMRILNQLTEQMEIAKLNLKNSVSSLSFSFLYI